MKKGTKVGIGLVVVALLISALVYTTRNTQPREGVYVCGKDGDRSMGLIVNSTTITLINDGTNLPNTYTRKNSLYTLDNGNYAYFNGKRFGAATTSKEARRKPFTCRPATDADTLWILMGAY